MVAGDAKECGDACANAANGSVQTCAVWLLDGAEWFTGCAPEALCNKDATKTLDQFTMAAKCGDSGVKLLASAAATMAALAYAM